MLRVFLLLVVLVVLGSALACSQMSSGGGGATPTEAYKLLFAAVKSKNTEAIKKNLTKKSIEFGAMAAQRNGSSLEKIFENGFKATTFSDKLPTMRDERINGDMGALEVWNSKESKWEDLAFIKEDGVWKLAVGDMFAGTYTSPGPGRDVIEKQAANAAANSEIQSALITNSNVPMPGINTASNKPTKPKNR